MLTLEQQQALVVANRGIALHWARKLAPKKIRQDAYQEGCLYLTIAAQTYDPSKSKFITYAWRPVCTRIGEFVDRWFKRQFQNLPHENIPGPESSREEERD